jgi:hypothetical protein
VVPPVKHCRRPGFLATRGMPLPLPAAAVPFQARYFAGTIQNDSLPCMVDGRDIICQERYGKFLQRACCVAYQDRE